MKPRWFAVAFAAVPLLGACASFSPRAGLSETRDLVSARGVDIDITEAPSDCAATTPLVRDTLAAPLDPERAVALALACNPALAAEFASLGIARAEAFEATRLANPHVTAASFDSNEAGASRQWSLGVAQNLAQLLLRGPRRALAEGEFLRSQQLLAGAIFDLAVDTKAAYHRALVARLSQQLHALDAEAARTSADLARAFHDAGNISARELAEAEATALEAARDARAAEQSALAAHVALRQLLGLPVDVEWTWPEGVALPLAEEDAHDGLQARAVAMRLDLAAADKLVELLATGEASTRRWRWLGDVELGVDYERETDRSRLLGPSLSIQLPLFDQGQGRVARAQALREWGEAERRRLRLRVANDVDLACRAVQAARAQVEDDGERLLPARARVTAETQREVNFMLRGPFELIEQRRAEYAAHLAYLDALRDYWLARAELERATGARLPSDTQAATRAYTLDALMPTETAPMPAHHHHGAHP